MHAMLSFNKLARGPTTRLHKLRLSACLRALLPFCRLRPFASCAARLKLIKTSTRSNAGCFSARSNQIQVRSTSCAYRFLRLYSKTVKRHSERLRLTGTNSNVRAWMHTLSEERFRLSHTNTSMLSQIALRRALFGLFLSRAYLCLLCSFLSLLLSLRHTGL